MMEAVTEFVLQEELHSHVVHLPQDSDLAFNSAPLLRQNDPAFNPDI